MLALPPKTELSKPKPLSKAAVYRRFDLSNKEKEHFDEDISRLFITNEITPETVNINAGKNISSFYVIKVEFKHKDFDDRNIIRLSKLIEQNMLFVLEYKEECCLAVYRTKLIKSDWQDADKCFVEITGLDLDEVWDNIVMQTGNFSLENENTVEEQIAQNENRDKILKEIERLEKKARSENQPKKKFELVQRIKGLKKELELNGKHDCNYYFKN